MCGIAGFAGSDKRVIDAMTAALSHRGPDGHATWTNERASLGHCRLAILDPRPEGNQPMWNDDHTIAIVYNGEIYNHRELREAEGLRCRTNTDTETLLRLYEKHGIDFVTKLRGMFAFAIYDAKKDEWHLVRDTEGIKPLFIAYPNGRLAFASEMRALLKAMPRKPAIDRVALSLYVRLQYVPGPRTMCEGIEQLPPGTILTVRRGMEKRTIFRRNETSTLRSKADFREAFPAIMSEAVQAHLISDKPVGLFLSGGMDSSIVLHHMSEHARKPIKTFTVRFDATDEEGAARFNADAELARKTAEFYGTDHREIFLSATDFRDSYADVARSLDRPNANAVAVAQFFLAREAKKDVDVALTGIGGDELFGGYPRHRIARVLHAVRFVPPALRSAAAALLGRPTDVLRMRPGPALAERLLARPADEGSRMLKDAFDEHAVTRLFEERFAALDSSDPVRASMEFDRRLWLVDEALHLTDATTMGSGLEARVPFLDAKIAAAAHAMPSRAHVGLLTTKKLLKETYLDILPPHLFTLKKASFYPPVAKWLRREALPLAEAMLENPRIAEYFDLDSIRVMVNEHAKRERYHLHALLTLIQLSAWFEEVYDG